MLRNRCLGRSSGSGAKQKPLRPEPEPEPEPQSEHALAALPPAVSAAWRSKQSTELLAPKCVPSPSPFSVAPAIAVGSSRAEAAAESHAVTSASALASRSQSVGPRQRPHPNPTVAAAAAQHRSVSNTQLAGAAVSGSQARALPVAVGVVVATRSVAASASVTGSAPAARLHTPTRPLRSRSAVIRERISTLYVCTLVLTHYFTSTYSYIRPFLLYNVFSFFLFFSYLVVAIECEKTVIYCAIATSEHLSHLCLDCRAMEAQAA